ncbi:sugar kinase [Methylobacillus sp. MM3]|jgi:adenosine kinase|uniref:carbohydrate kinase family protein n=1 Tax=Methylobacillus sp. MM3 TaxID=1848039 RepID=UPI0007DF7F41|nr:carbohydrate kinase family protein [Methylobacillus sp. MM3]OAJ70353.1 sugar kinase [Methylobacillus sp. MM3]
MQTLICGSLAFDTIMVFPDHFKHHILPEKIHILNVAFLVPEMRREFGGTAGNIAYNLNLLGGNPLIMATVGDDFGPYAERLKTMGIKANHVRHISGSYTAQAFITTDLADNQITAFHPGAMNNSHENSVKDTQDVSLAIIAPDGREGMFQHARELHEAGIPFMFDPGQGLPMFNGQELMHFLGMADYLAVNDYEAQMMQEKTGQSMTSLAQQVKALIVTRGAEGSIIYAEGQRFDIPCVEADAVLDPTGCGDAYRAGLVYGIQQGWDWQRTGQLAAVMGSIKIASRGGQNHVPSKDDIAARYRKAFGTEPVLV